MADFEGVSSFLWNFVLFLSHSSDITESNGVSLPKPDFSVSAEQACSGPNQLLAGTTTRRYSLIFTLVNLLETVTPLGWMFVPLL